MIPHNLIRDTIGYCTESPIWWAMWADLVTRADVLEMYGWRLTARTFALTQGLDPGTTIRAFPPPWHRWLREKYGDQNVSNPTYPRPPLCACGELGWAPCPTLEEDYCRDPRLPFPYCNGWCEAVQT